MNTLDRAHLTNCQRLFIRLISATLVKDSNKELTIDKSLVNGIYKLKLEGGDYKRIKEINTQYDLFMKTYQFNRTTKELFSIIKTIHGYKTKLTI